MQVVCFAENVANPTVCRAVQPRMTMARTIKLYKLPDKPRTPGIRPLEKRDVPQASH